VIAWTSDGSLFATIRQLSLVELYILQGGSMNAINKLIVVGLTLSAIGTVAAQELTAAQVKTRIEAAGYTNVRDIRREGDHFDAKASKDGKQVSLDVDARSGAVKLEEEDEEEDEKDK
jgi:hypothetical protein